MFGKIKDADRVVRSRARDRARWLIRDHGEEAEAVIAGKLARPNLGAADRLLYKLTQRELRALRHADRMAQKRAFLFAQPLRLLARLFGGQSRNRRRSRR